MYDKPLISRKLETNKPLCCPECRADMSGVTGEGLPSEGAISICMYCQSINKFMGKGMDLHLAKIEQAELDDIKNNHPGTWAKIWQYIYTIKEVMYDKKKP